MTTTKLFASLLVVFLVACAQNKPPSAPTARPSPTNSVEAEPPQTQLEEQDRARTGMQDVLLEGGMPGPR